jgi:hypothetical protein
MIASVALVREYPQHGFTNECAQFVIGQGAENPLVFIPGADERPSIRRETSQRRGNAEVMAAAGMHTVVFRPAGYETDFWHQWSLKSGSHNTR